MSFNRTVRRGEYLTGIQGVIANGNALVPIETGFSYDKLKIAYSESGVLADLLTTGIDRVQLIVDGKIKRDLDPAKMIDLVKLNGHTVDTGELPLMFTQPSRATVADEEFTMLDLTNAGSAHLNIKLNAGATSPSIEVIAQRNLKQSARNENGQQYIAHHEALSFTFGGSGTHQISDLPKGKDISRLLFYFDGSAIDKIELNIDGTIQTQLTTDENNRELVDRGFAPASTGIGYAVVFDIDQRASSVIRAIRKILAKVDVTAAGTCTVVVETLEPLA